MHLVISVDLLYTRMHNVKPSLCQEEKKRSKRSLWSVNEGQFRYIFANEIGKYHINLKLVLIKLRQFTHIQTVYHRAPQSSYIKRLKSYCLKTLQLKIDRIEFVCIRSNLIEKNKAH